jgi:CheY-like chemotaxis protein
MFNAVKHAYINEIRIIAEISGHVTRFIVEDEGAGFDVAELRVRQSSNDSLGLFSIQERIAALGGTMAIESRPGVGTRVVLELPQKTKDERPLPRHPQRHSGKYPREHHARTGDTVRVMLVDDHQLVREGIGNLLKESEHIWVVGTADNGLEAVTKAGELRPDVILMDANMPLMNGIEATRNIRNVYPGIQVVGLSVQNDEAMRESFAQAGACAFLSKDGDLHCLLETILNCGAAAKAL